VDQTASKNTEVSFEVWAFSPSELSYQWYKDGVAIEGATSPTYFIESAQGEDSGTYAVTMSTEYAKVSRQATLDVVTKRTGDPDSDFQYTLNGKTATITGYLGTNTNVAIPNIIEGCLVTCIGDEAFAGCSSSSITISDSVTSIGDEAFAGCSSLSITIPDSVTLIGNRAFLYCKVLTSITIPDSVTLIGDSAFFGCSSLTSVVIGNSVTSIGFNAFRYCSSLKIVYFKGYAPSIGGSTVFSDCQELETIYYVEGTTGWTNPWQGIATATWVPEPEPTVPELAYAVEGGKLVLSWAASSGAALEVSTQVGAVSGLMPGSPKSKRAPALMKRPSLRAQPTIGSSLSKKQNSERGGCFCAPLLKTKKTGRHPSPRLFSYLRLPYRSRGNSLQTGYLLFAELLVHQLLDLIQSLTSILSCSLDQNVTTFTRCQHHQTHNAFTIDLFTIFFNIDGTFVTSCQFYKL
jgi:hypothetical protein